MSEQQEWEFTQQFTVQLDMFDGPIGLLLHLVKQNELEIEKVALAEVASQYMQCIEQAKGLDLDLAGEYLVIAATLLSIKSSYLLDEPAEMVPDEEGNLIDPHEELLNRLREAEVYKEGASLLGSRDWLGHDVFAPPQSIKKVKGIPVKYRDHDAILLGKAFKKIIDQVEMDSTLYRITMEPVSIVDTMMSIVDTLQNLKQVDQQKGLPFEQVIPDATSRMSLIASFIAILELCKRQALVVRQDDNFSGIFIALASIDGALADIDSASFSSEFDDSGEEEDRVANLQ